MLTGWRTEYDAVDQEALYRHPKLVNLNHRGIVRHVSIGRHIGLSPFQLTAILDSLLGIYSEIMM